MDRTDIEEDVKKDLLANNMEKLKKVLPRWIFYSRKIKDYTPKHQPYHTTSKKTRRVGWGSSSFFGVRSPKNKDDERKLDPNLSKLLGSWLNEYGRKGKPYYLGYKKE